MIARHNHTGVRTSPGSYRQRIERQWLFPGASARRAGVRMERNKRRDKGSRESAWNVNFNNGNVNWNNLNNNNYVRAVRS